MLIASNEATVSVVSEVERIEIFTLHLATRLLNIAPFCFQPYKLRI